MKSLVLEIQQDALDNSVSISALLQKAYVVARKLQVEEMVEWVNRELNGFGPGTHIPEYRKVVGQPQAWNPYNGWIPIVFNGNERTAKMFSEKYIAQPIAQLEELLKNPTNESLHIPYPTSIQEKLKRFNEVDFESSLVIDRSQIASILTAIRKVVLEWSLKLEEENILGEGLSFSKEEKGKSKEPSKIVIQNFQGVLGDVEGGIVNQTMNMEVLKGDISSLRAFLSSKGVGSEDIKEIEEGVRIEPDQKVKGEFGPRVSGWIGKMITKAGTGAWKISIDVAARLLTSALSKYYGMP